MVREKERGFKSPQNKKPTASTAGLRPGKVILAAVPDNVDEH
jgi:hypothetical protein